MTTTPVKIFTRDEVAKHNSDSDNWIIVNNKVYDITKFSKVHPGGKVVLTPLAGQDCTEQFFALHRSDVLRQFGPKLLVGHLKDEEPIELPANGTISQVPYAESSAFQKGFFSAYYKESHHRYRKALRLWLDENIRPHAQKWDEDGTIASLEIYKEMGKQGILAARLGPGPHIRDYPQLGNVQPDEFDFFHELIITEEFSTIGYPGVIDSLSAGFIIGLPPVQKFGSKALQDRIIPEVLSGNKRICLAITDPDAGSDVAGLTCVAKKSECGKFYIVNGTKKWITNGTFCDYFTTAVRTGDKGIFGISMMVIERTAGVSTKLIKTSYSPSAGTAYITFENVKVPVENLLGEENDGFRCIMANFNHERWMIAVGIHRANRAILEECFKWAHQRKVFGKPLINQPVIRNKLAHMTAQIEAVQNWIENVTFQMCNMNYKQQTKYLAGPIALLKLQTTRVSQYIADQACQIFGGRAITRTGMGQFVERFQKSYKFQAIYGGSEEIMADLGIKMAMRMMPENARL